MQKASLLLPLAAAALLLALLLPPTAAEDGAEAVAAAAAEPAHFWRGPKYCTWPPKRGGYKDATRHPCHASCKRASYYAKRCRQGTCQGLPQPVANGRWPDSCRGAAASAGCTASCIAPYFGSPTSTCQPSGAWSAPAGRCLRLGSSDWTPVSPVPAPGTGPSGKIVFVNNCKDGGVGVPVYVYFQSGPGGTTTNLVSVAPGTAVAKDLQLAATPDGAWRFTMVPAPWDVPGVGCPNCDAWTDRGQASDCTDEGRACYPTCPRTTGSMWLANGNATRAKAIAYCSPINSARAGVTPRCAASASRTPCCGPQDVFSGLMTGSYGSLFELSRARILENSTQSAFGCGYNDFIDISTNFQANVTQPPLNYGANNRSIAGCGQGNDVQVARNANVYFSIPFDVATNDVDNQSFSNTVQACTLAGTALAHSWSCRTANCTDAYKDPTDKKQWVCQSGCNTELYSYNRFYQVRMCPGNGATNVYEL